jgi:putative protein kinase ArgK-like GTPase of G3E family
LEGAREALSSASARHVEQLAKERADMAMALREAKAANLRSALGGYQRSQQPSQSQAFSAPVSPSLGRGLQELLAWLQEHRTTSEQEGKAAEDPTTTLLERMCALVVEAERGRSEAETDGRIAGGEALALRSRLRELEMAFESRTNEWEAASASRAAAERMAHRELQQRSRQATARAKLHEQHMAAVQRELQVGFLELIGYKTPPHTRLMA